MTVKEVEDVHARPTASSSSAPLTLEGIAAQVDPDFNIYEMALPFALRIAGAFVQRGRRDPS